MAERLKKGQSVQAESIPGDALGLDEEAQEQDYGDETGGQEKRKRGATPGHKGHGRKIPKNLPVREQIIDIAENQKKCDCCGEPLIETPELDQVSSEISKEVIYYIKRTVRKAYKKTCNCP